MQRALQAGNQWGRTGPPKPRIVCYVGGNVMMKSRGVVREIFQHKGKTLIAFPTHDGLFKVEDGRLLEILRKAHEEKREISFTFDAELKILAIDAILPL